jgi:hypothetical protein
MKTPDHVSCSALLCRCYDMVQHGHSPGVMELNSIQLAHRHDVAPCGKSYGYNKAEFFQAVIKKKASKQERNVSKAAKQQKMRTKGSSCSFFPTR